MIRTIFFKDDSIPTINCNIPEGTFPIIVTGVSGITCARKMLDKMSADYRNWALFTNDPLIVDDAKDMAELSYDSIFVFDMDRHEFAQAQTTTRKELKNANRFSKLWLGGTFRNTYNVNV